MMLNFTKKHRLKLSKVYFVDKEGNLVVKKHFVLSLWLMSRSFWEFTAFIAVFAAHIALMILVMYATLLWFRTAQTDSHWVSLGLVMVLEVVVLGLILFGIAVVMHAFHKKYLAEKVQKFIDRFEDNINPPDRSALR